MTSKLKCPFCGEELDPRFDAYHETITSWVCINEKCVSFDWEFPPKAWQALIQAKQDLEIARSALEDIKSDYELYSEQGCRMEPNETDMYNYARKALEQIEHKE